MPNKTPYEIRLDVLKMARDLEMENYQQFAQPFWQIHAQLEQHIESFDDPDDLDVIGTVNEIYDLIEALEKSIPKMPTIAQINQKAKELYEFVEQK